MEQKTNSVMCCMCNKKKIILKGKQLDLFKNTFFEQGALCPKCENKLCKEIDSR